MRLADSDKGYSLKLSTHGDVLCVQVVGDVDAQAIRLAYWNEIAAIGKERGFRKLLVVDRKKQVPATPAELAELADAMRIEREHFERVAVVEPTPAFVPAIEHAEIHGQERGINVRVFGQRDEAERWLRYGAS
jgi:hypothetical protein